ncbi:elongation factor G [Rhodobacter aestuarii]|uniref:Elongation factor G n=1 Tax=Rhodobacter aestuarii TaxID=453582 RepID=A0A1N7P575_9RHOB|nr:elongation factor G [Rhodobacter aestuarii]PTV97588.1 elongation factor G [Rhodobacter aestuarii]SIT05690.1 elongation factor G [Rhodobacter aestuarii]
MKVVSIVGPSQAGKSTLADALATLEGGKPRKHTLFGDAAVTKFSFMEEDWAILDAPGGADHLPQLAPMLAASDAVVLCVPADAEAAVLVAPYLRLVEEADLPTFIFINKIDTAQDRTSEIVAALQNFCPHGIVLRQIPIRENGQVIGAVDLISERAWEYHDHARSSLMELPASVKDREEEARTELLEHLADFDEVLLTELIEDQAPMTDEVYDVSTKVLQHHDLLPALLGSASHGNGMMRLMKSLRHEVPGVDETAARVGALAVGALADNVKHLGKTVLVRALSEGVAPGAKLAGANIGSITDIDAKTQLSALAPGEIGLTVKTDHLSLAAPLYTAEGSLESLPWMACHAANHALLIEPENERDETRLAAALPKLMEIDPGLSVQTDPITGKTLLGTQGPLHLRRVLEKLEGDFGIKAVTAPQGTALCETITGTAQKQYRHRKQSGGAGQFADVVIEVKPLGRGEGFQFTETVKGGAVPRNYIPSVEAGARDALTAGPKGHPVVDLAVNLSDGKHHAVDSSDHAFRTAGKMALREVLTELGTVVLQPVCKVVISVPSVYSGGLSPLVSGLKGQVLGFEADPGAKGWDLFEALMPASSLTELFQSLGGATRGTASFTATLDHYEEQY